MLALIWEVVFKGVKPPFQSYLPIFIILVSIYIPIGVRISAKKVWASNDLHQNLHYSIMESGVSDGHSNLAWDDIFKVSETKGYFAFFISKEQVYLLPKRCFDNTSQIDLVRQILREKLPYSKPLK